MRIIYLFGVLLTTVVCASPTARELIADATGKLEKLNNRSNKIYVEYLSDWPRAKNFIKKLQKMQTAISSYLTKCGYDMLSIQVLESVWNVDLNRDGHIADVARKRRSQNEFDLTVKRIDTYWREFDEYFESDLTSGVQVDEPLAIPQKSANGEFNLHFVVHDPNGNERNEYIKIQKMFNGYAKFVKIYLTKCKKIDKIEKRVSKTNTRLLGAIGKYDRYLLKVAKQTANKAAKESKKNKKSSKKDKKQKKRILSEEKN